ncbi:MAG: gluconolactonase [Pirellulaceae bacterium]|jgi:gluconolactonase
MLSLRQHTLCHSSKRVRLSRLFHAIALLLVGAPTHLILAADEPLPLPESHSVVPQLYATGFEFAEGPAIDKSGNLFAVNYRRAGTIGRITPMGEASIWCDLVEAVPVDDRVPRANGLKLDGENRLIVADAGGGRLLRISSDGQQVEVLADRCEGNRFNSINDVALDDQGNIYFSDPGGSSAESPTGSVYRFDIGTKKTTRLATDMAFPNGLAVSPDQERLCVSESQAYRILSFDIQDDGTVDNPQVVIEFPPENVGSIRGGRFDPDGMVFDKAGRLYVAMWIGGVINVVDVKAGKLIRQYNAGGLKATNCHFHGDYLYVTVAAKEAVFRLKLGVEGHMYQ